MALAAGTRLGPYEILGPIGAGGMGEVYRGRDTRLAREVAIKVLLPGLAVDPDFLRRFDAEARAGGRLNHPNILAIYDIGTHDGAPYIVSELLEGETLRDRLAGPQLAIAKAIDFAVQIAHGLGEAHSKGVTHRDLKPENLFITRGDRIKILDFGLAKVSDGDAAMLGATVALTGIVRTEPGALLGSVGYMSPEQARGQPADRRSDIFSFGAILFEMIAGHRPFRGGSAVEALNAILKDEPPPLSAGGRAVPASLERIVQRCLEKAPEARWQTATDLAFALEALSISNPASTPASVAEPSTVTVQPHAREPRHLPIRPIAGVAIGLAVAAIAAAYVVGRTLGQPSWPSFHRITFGRGTVMSAKFAADGATIAYSAAWDGKPIELFSTRPDSPDSRSLGILATDVLAVSSTGEMALLVKPGSVLEWGWKLGTLARASLAGGAPRETQRGVQFADWSPDGVSLAIVRASGTRSRVEFPAGTLLYETPQSIGALRISRSGDRVAFAERPPGLAAGWSIGLLDRSGKETVVSSGWSGDFIDLAWSPRGDEIWFDTRQGGDDSLHAVTVGGRDRVLARLAVPVQLFDVSRDGRALVGRAYFRGGIMGVPPGDTKERDLSWLDASEVDDVSFDGRQLLITEFGEGGGAGRGSIFLRAVDGSPAVRLGEGQGFALSPDGARALSLRHTSPPELVLLPTGAGEPIVLKNAGISDYTWAEWVPDGKRIVFNGVESGHGPRCFVQGIDGSAPRAITPEGTTLIVGQRVVSPDGEWVAAIGADGKPSLYPLAGGTPRPIAGVEPGDVPIRWTVDERGIYVFRKAGVKPSVFAIDLSTGRGELWREIVPPDPAGIVNIWGVHIGPDDRSYYYSYMRNLSDLYLVDGLK